MIKLDFVKAFKHERYVLNIFGLYPGLSGSYRKFFTKFTYIIMAIIQLTLALIQLGISKDFTNLVDCAIFSIGMINFLIKAVVLHFKKDVLDSITDYLEKIDESKVGASIRQNLKNHEIIRGQLGNMFRLATFLYVLLQVLIVFFQKGHTFLPVNTWTPFNIYLNIVYFGTVTFQLLVIGIEITCDTSLDCLYYVLADVACCQLDILKYNLIKINPKGNKVKQKLIECIQYHQEIIKFVNQIERVFSMILFLEFFKGIVDICLIGFELTMVEFLSLHFFMRIIYLNGLLLEVCGFCWFGHALISKSAEVEDSCYLMRWDECNTSIQKLIWMIMVRSHKPLAVRALFLTFTMSTLTTILKTSYSYTTVLRTMYE